MHTLLFVKNFTSGTDVAVGSRKYKAGVPLSLYRHPKHGRTFIQTYDGPFIFLRNSEYFHRLVQIGIKAEEATRLSGFKPKIQSLTNIVKPVALLPGSAYGANVKEAMPQTSTNNQLIQIQTIMAKKSKPAAQSTAPVPPAPGEQPQVETQAPPAPPVPGEALPPAPAVPPPIVPEKVKEPTQNGITRPSAGTTTRSVWDTSDAITQQTGAPAKRADVVAACSAAGVNVSTATTQYGKWAKFHGHVGDKSPGRKAKADAPAAPAPVPAPPAPGDVDAAFQAGYDGYNLALTGASVANPYSEGSDDALKFQQGWNQAHADKQAQG